MGKRNAILGWGLLFAQSGYSLGGVGIDVSSFLRSSQTQQNINTTMNLGLDLKKSGDVFEGAINLSAYLYTDDPSALTFELSETFLATSKSLMQDDQFFFGRKRFDWSIMDQKWNFGLWNTRFMWDPLRPQTVGLTGLFYHHQGNRWRAIAHLSAIDMPERGYPTYAVDGRLVSPSRFFNPLPQSINIYEGVDADIQYDILYPSLGTMLFRPSMAFSFRYGERVGPWVNTSYGFLTVHQPDLAVNAGLDAQNFVVRAEIHPRFRLHHLMTVESGYQGELWSVWASITGEAPLDVETPSGWLRNPVGPALISSFGGEVSWYDGFSLSGSFLMISENQPAQPDLESSLSIPLPSRFDYRRAIRAAGKWDGGSPVLYDLGWVYDLENSNSMIQLEITYPSPRKRNLKQNWGVHLGFDLIFTENKNGWIGQFAGNDRVRGGFHMHSKVYSRGIPYLGFVFLLSGCGLLGTKDMDPTLIQYSTEGCLNEFGGHLKKYFTGELNPSDWEKSITCAQETLQTLQKFTRGSAADGYSIQDLHNLVSKVLVTNSHVPPELIPVSLKLKASLLGGDEKSLNKKQLSFLIDVLDVFKKESTALIPYLRLRRENPTPENMLEMARRVEQAVGEIASKISLSGTSEFSKGDAKSLIAAVNSIHQLDIEPYWMDILYSLKSILVGGDAQTITASNWGGILKQIGTLGGVSLAIASVATHVDFRGSRVALFRHEIGKKIYGLFRTSAMVGIEFSKFTDLLKAMPLSFFRGDREILGVALTNLFRNLLKERSDTRLGAVALERAYGYFDRWNQYQIHLERIFEDYRLNRDNVGSSHFAEVALEYQKRISVHERPHIDILRQVALEHRVLFGSSGDQILYQLHLNNSINNLSKMSLYHLVSSVVMEAYSKTPKHEKINLPDFQAMFDDYKDAAAELLLISRDYAQWATKRFTEGDIFTFKSNGDGWIDQGEAIHLIATLNSISRMSERIWERFVPLCKNGDGPDELEIEWMDFGCFKGRFFEARAEMLDHFPGVLKFYESLNTKSAQQFQMALEKGSRRYGVSNLPFASYDTVNWVGILHYIETVWMRFDGNTDQRFTLSEVLQAAPVFGRKIAEIGKFKASDRKMIEAVFTYLIKYGDPPQSFWDKVHFILWKLGRPFWSINVSRLRIFEIASLFNAPEPIPKR